VSGIDTNAGGSWHLVTASNLPDAPVNDLAVSPDGSYLVAATHGRALWRIS
jgi:hypothetical protein